jgi:hypothetical protein
MLKFVKGYMESIEGIATYPMISLLIFFIFFSILLIWVLTTSKDHIKEMSEMPLENNNQQNEQL